MHRVEPEVFLVAETHVNEVDCDDYLHIIGAPGWETGASSDGEALVEFMGRLCYRSFGADLNANLTRVRDDHDEYIANILDVGHGSVLEHASVSFVFRNVSRVFTHELVRHRPGVAISQESLRFVRLDDLGMWAPSCIRENPEALAIFEATFERLEQTQIELAKLFGLDDEGVPFARKKEVTSAMRRIAPIGLATAIGWTANLRTLRWLLEMRTHPAAEEEIRLVFGKVGQLLTTNYPAVFGDFDVEEVNGLPHYKPRNSKV